MLRKAVVKGSFYPDDIARLTNFIEKYKSTEAHAVLGGICPHAGYVYSGETAVKTLSSMNIPDRVIILSPNHTGAGSLVSVSPDCEWETPFGSISVEKEMLKGIINHTHFKEDILAHLQEHSIEVILPILKYLNPAVQILPITIQQLSISECHDVAIGLHALFNDFKDVLLIVSSDMNHFEPSDISEIKDKKAITDILDLKPERLYETVMQNEISMCGVFPTVVSLMVFNMLGAVNTELVQYTHSGHINGDFSSVVGYAGVLIQ